MKSKLKKTLLLIFGLIFGGLSLVYLFFTIVLAVNEGGWLGEAPDHPALDAIEVSPHSIELIDHGFDSLKYRLELIESAKESIELEFFIFEIDHASRLISAAIAKKASEGIDVRILVDFAKPVFRLSPHYAKKLSAAGVRVKYYNTKPATNLFQIQHRTHRKMMVIDGQKAMIGGRNIGDEYFDLSSKLNFLDTDIIVEGKIVKQIQRGFDLYWQSDWTTQPEKSKYVDTQATIGKRILKLNEDDRKLLERIHRFKHRSQKSTCDVVQFVTDFPGSGVENRRVFKVIVDLMGRTKKTVIAESPYLILRPIGQTLIKNTLAKGVSLSILTNSLASTDGFYTISALMPDISHLNWNGFAVSSYQGKALKNYPTTVPAEAVWTIHSKRAVFDEKIAVVGTYNIDPRSANFNSELILICHKGDKFAADLQRSILRRAQQSRPVIDGEKEPNYRSLLGDSSFSYRAKMFLAIPIAYLFNFLF